MLDLLQSLGDWVPRLQIALPIGFGIWAIWRMQRPPVAARPDRPTVVAIATALAIVGLTVGTLVFSSLAGLFSGGPNFGVGLQFGIAAAILLPLSCLAGYTALAARGVGRAVWLGFLLALLVLIAGPLVIYGQLINLAYQ